MPNLETNIAAIRKSFPILDQRVHGHNLVYLDNAATTQVPDDVIGCIVDHYHRDNANVHRGIHALSERSTAGLEHARERARAFVNANSSDEIVFTGGTTDGINMAARMLEPRIAAEDTVAVTALEHHANFVPWQQLCQRTGAHFAIVPIDAAGDVDLDALENLLSTQRAAIVACTHVSNVTGTVNPVKEIAARVHAHGGLMLVDAAQSIRHEAVDVQDLDCDFLCFSGHKTCGPTGIGILYAKSQLLERLAPVTFGGEMVDEVTAAFTTFEAPPLRFEAGTPNYVGAIGLGAALGYLDRIGRGAIAQREHELVAYAERKLAEIERLTVLGNPRKRAGCLSFAVDQVHPFDLAKLLDAQGVALRSGNQCAQPLLHETFGIKNVTRLSPAFYNTFAEIDACIEALDKAICLLKS